MDIPSNTPKVVTVAMKKPMESPVLAPSLNPLEKKTQVSEAIQLIKVSLLNATSKTSHLSQVVKPGISVEKAPQAVNTIQVDGGRHTSEGSSGSGSPYSIASFILLIAAVVGFIAGLFGAIAAFSDGFIYLLTFAFVADIVAIVLAIIGISHHEDAKGFAIVALALNGLLVLLYLIGLISTFSHI